jgi:DNA-binding GntR family transcriptional regulator
MEYFSLNQAVHSAIVRVTGNEPMLYAHTALQTQIQHIRYIGHGGEDNWDTAMQEHEAFMKCLAERNADEAVRNIVRHFTGTWERVQSSLE